MLIFSVCTRRYEIEKAPFLFKYFQQGPMTQRPIIMHLFAPQFT